jgi:protein-L-isoaspartate(D-aspartate) O-methyltransferase
VPADLRLEAYADSALPIGHGQTISQPYVVALMTETLRLSPGDRVLEVGTGSGYQTAVLAEIVAEVYSVEIIPELHERARRDLRELGYENVHLELGDGSWGLPEHAPYDAIIVTCSTPEVPPALLDQLVEGGRMCIPLGRPDRVQNLTSLEKGKDSAISREEITCVRFVPMVKN